MQNIIKNSAWSQELYLKAIRFAGKVHGNQKIPGTDLPYIIHLSSVCMEVIAAISIEQSRNPDLAVQCALLHDTMEDAGIKFDEINNLFGQDVAEGILSLTKNKSLKKEMRMADSIRRIRQQPHEIWMVKLADRISNLQPPPPAWTHEKINKYRIEAAYILEELGEASPYLSERLGEKIENYSSGESS